MAADNVIATLRGCVLRPYRRTSVESAASLGLDQGVAQVYRRRLRGLPAWLAHRKCHLLALSSWNRRLRVVADWLLALLLPREIVSLDAGEHVREEFTTAAEETTGRR